MKGKMWPWRCGNSRFQKVENKSVRESISRKQTSRVSARRHPSAKNDPRVSLHTGCPPVYRAVTTKKNTAQLSETMRYNLPAPRIWFNFLRPRCLHNSSQITKLLWDPSANYLYETTQLGEYIYIYYTYFTYYTTVHYIEILFHNVNKSYIQKGTPKSCNGSNFGSVGWEVTWITVNSVDPCWIKLDWFLFLLVGCWNTEHGDTISRCE